MTEHKCFVFTFNDVEVREREFCIVKAGKLLPVEPKAFRVLLFLIRSPHRLIAKDELLDAVWNDCTVSDNSLTRSIALLRRLLGDDTREPRYIATVPTVGYRFLCDVTFAEDGFCGPNAASLREVGHNNDPEPIQTVDAQATALGAVVTPLPELLADTGSARRLSPPVAISCLAVVLIGLVGMCFLRQRVDIINQIPMDNTPEVLAAKSREIAKSFDYMKRPVDTSFGWFYNGDYLRYASAQKGFSVRGAHFDAQHPPAVLFWYRESSRYLVDFTGIYAPMLFERDTLQPGMLEVVVDSEGRLIEFRAQPTVEVSGRGLTPELDWSHLFLAAGLDPSRFVRVRPTTSPQNGDDTQAAWIGSWDASSNDPITVEAEAHQGRPVFFRIIEPWIHADQHAPWSAGVFNFASFLFFLVVLPIGTGLLAWRNARLRRSDQRGAIRLAGAASLCMFLGSVAVNNYAPTSAEIAILFSSLRDALVAAIILWALYMAVDPPISRRSPETLLAWKRLLAGRFRDPLVGGEVLVGLALGILGNYVDHLVPLGFIEPIAPRLMPHASAFFSLWCWHTIASVCIGLTSAFVLNVLLLVIRRQWLAVSIFVIVMTVGVGQGYPLAAATARPVFLLLMAAYALLRFGVLAAVAFFYVHNLIMAFPMTTNLSVWYAPAAMFAIASVLALAIYAFQVTVPGQRFWKDSLDGL